MSGPRDDQDVDAIAILVTEWYKISRRLRKLTAEVAGGRLDRELAQLAYSEQRVNDTLAALDVRHMAYDGLPFSPQLPVEPVNPEDFDTEEGLTVAETLEPTIIHHGKVVLRGRAILAKGD